MESGKKTINYIETSTFPLKILHRDESSTSFSCLTPTPLFPVSSKLLPPSPVLLCPRNLSSEENPQRIDPGSAAPPHCAGLAKLFGVAPFSRFQENGLIEVHPFLSFLFSSILSFHLYVLSSVFGLLVSFFSFCICIFLSTRLSFNFSYLTFSIRSFSSLLLSSCSPPLFFLSLLSPSLSLTLFFLCLLFHPLIFLSFIFSFSFFFSPLLSFLSSIS